MASSKVLSQNVKMNPDPDLDHQVGTSFCVKPQTNTQKKPPQKVKNNLRGRGNKTRNKLETQKQSAGSNTLR